VVTKVSNSGLKRLGNKRHWTAGGKTKPVRFEGGEPSPLSRRPSANTEGVPRMDS